MTIPNRTFAYVNVFAATMMDEEPIRNYISEQLRTTAWRGFKNDFGAFSFLSDGQEDYISFFDGISAEQFTNTQQNGVYINAMYCGLMVNFDRWNNVLKTKDSDVTFTYIDIPYELYQTADKRTVPTDKTLYESQSKKLKALVETLELEAKRVLN